MNLFDRPFNLLLHCKYQRSDVPDIVAGRRASAQLLDVKGRVDVSCRTTTAVLLSEIQIHGRRPELDTVVATVYSLLRLQAGFSFQTERGYDGVFFFDRTSDAAW